VLTTIGRNKECHALTVSHKNLPCKMHIPYNKKKQFPKIKILQYRITDAVPYAEIVHSKMVSDPSAFVRWTNGSICTMPEVEHGTTGFNCSWEIRAAAYDWSQQRVQDWFLENIIKPVMKVADGAWIDGDGPDNGAYMCSGNWNYDNLPKPYPALTPDEIAVFCDGENKVSEAAQKWLLSNGGFEYNCFTWITSSSDLPTPSDKPDVCASKIVKLDHRPAKSALVVYGDRISEKGYNDGTAAQAVAVFMLTRDQYWYFGFPCANTYNATTAALLLSNFGKPLGNMTRPDPKKYLFEREYELATVSFDCATFSAKFTKKSTVDEV